MGGIDRSILLETFKEEASEHIKTITNGLIELEKDNENEEVLLNIFRSAHSLKGASALMGFTNIRDLAHKLEDIFGEVRDKKISITPEIITKMLQSLDELKSLLENKDKKEEVKPGEIIEKPAKEIIKNVAAEIKDEEQLISNRRELDRRNIERRKTSRRTRDAEKTSTEKMQSIRIAVEKLDELMNLVGELVVTKISFDEPLQKLLTTSNEIENVNKISLYIKKRLENFMHIFPKEEEEEMENNLSQLENSFSHMRDSLLFILNNLNESMRKFDVICNNLQEGIMASRMLPLSTIFDEFHRSVRDMSLECHKEVNLIIKGADTELDKKILEEMKDPLIHLLRNAVDHGIELPDERISKNKIREGVVVINAFHQGSCICIEVEDDGAGIDRNILREKIVEKGLSTKKEVMNMTDNEILDFIFLPGFSTKKIITDLSGRGIGMSIVKKNVGELKGTIHINSVVGEGTKMSVKLPLTLAIMQVLLVKCKGETFAIPLSHIQETHRTPLIEVKTVEKKTVIDYYGQVIPLIYLHEVLKIKTDDKGEEKREVLPIIVLDSGDEKIGIVIDELVGRKEIVSKTLGNFLGKIKNVAGATIMGTGEVILILDVPSLLLNSKWIEKNSFLNKHKKPISESKKSKIILVVDDSLTTRELEKTIIENAGFNVDIATNGKDALDKVTKGKYDLIVSDVDMPLMDGFTLTRTLKESQEYKNIPVIIVSAKKSDEYKKKGIDAGAEAYIVKSGFDQNNLLNVIESLIL
ncbi:hybrid sensor histidine kinase/response regulator [Candidatus Poribacteria bacterium]|nr:hybrid sensor histidine kinase/response regulator [Candidatus Poribacteria bacterium]